jgi:ATF/CREB family transcription factor
MFPAPSPTTQAIFNFQSGGGVTPSTADFQQSALRAAQVANNTKFPTTSAPTSQPDVATAPMDRGNHFSQPPQPAATRATNDPFSNHDVSNAANDLLSFATQNGGVRNGAQPFGMPNQQTQMNNAGHMPVQPISQENGRRTTKGSINSMTGSADTGDFSDSGQSERAKTTTRSRAKKGAANGKQTAGNKRKADEMPKMPGRKRTMNGSIASMDMDEEMDSEDETSPKPEDGRKMTDEEKRKNFLERNR